MADRGDRDSELWRISERDVPVLGTYDVVVCGGGPAGCAAALAASRRGARTLLVEKAGYLGGATVSQLVCVVLSTNGLDFQGVWHEWASRLLQRGAMAPLVRSSSPFYRDAPWLRASVDPEGVKRVWQEMLEEAGAEVLCLAHLCGACVEEGAARGVVVHTRGGLRAVRAGRVIDATGDGAVVHEAGAMWDRGTCGNPWGQEVSMVYRIGGVAAPGTEGGRAPGAGGTLAFRPEHLARVDRLRVDPLDPMAVSRAMRDARSEIWDKAGALPEGQYLVDTAAELGVRASRIVCGIDRVEDDAAWECRKAPDGIARSSWELDIHPPEKMESIPERWFHSRSKAYARRARRVASGDWFDIPFGCLVASGIDNLLVAGRCVSAGCLAHGSLRIQQTCMATGQAAGTIAALSLEAGVTPGALDPMVAVRKLEEDRGGVAPVSIA